eukprot:1607127-Prymnesium_polylepis.1
MRNKNTERPANGNGQSRTMHKLHKRNRAIPVTLTALAMLGVHAWAMVATTGGASLSIQALAAVHLQHPVHIRSRKQSTKHSLWSVQPTAWQPTLALGRPKPLAIASRGKRGGSPPFRCARRALFWRSR